MVERDSNFWALFFRGIVEIEGDSLRLLNVHNKKTRMPASVSIVLVMDKHNGFGNL
jgi:hypothetical protein